MKFALLIIALLSAVIVSLPTSLLNDIIRQNSNAKAIEIGVRKITQNGKYIGEIVDINVIRSLTLDDVLSSIMNAMNFMLPINVPKERFWLSDPSTRKQPEVSGLELKFQ